MRIAYTLLFTFIVIGVALALSSCAFTGTLDTPYGTATSDGKTVTVIAKPVVVKVPEK